MVLKNLPKKKNRSQNLLSDKLLRSKLRSIPDGASLFSNRFHPRSKLRGIQPLKNKMLKKVTIDARGIILGRLASEVAQLLRGKHYPSYRPNYISGDKVTVINAAQIKVTGDKMTQKEYFRHSGHLGNLKRFSLNERFKKNPAWVFKNAVSGMLPKNKLRKIYLKNLEVKNGA